MKHYVFKGNPSDVTPVTEVVKGLKQNYHIEETVFVGDRGMISKLNLAEIEEHGFDYIIGVKMHQNELYQSLLVRNEQELALDWEQDEVCEHRQLKVIERVVVVKEFLSWKAKLIVQEDQMKCSDETFRPFVDQIQGLTNTSTPDFRKFRNVLRECLPQVDSKLCQKIIALPAEREEAIAKLFGGYKATYRKFFQIERDTKTRQATGYRLNQYVFDFEYKFDGVCALLTSRTDLEAGKVIDSYKNLQEVEPLFDDLKNFVDMHPIRHRLEERVRAHVFLCILAL